MRDQFSLTLKIISTIVLVLFIWTFGGVFDIAYAVKNTAIEQKSNSAAAKTKVTPPGLPLPQGEGKKPENKFQKTIENIEQVLSDTATDTDTKKNKLKTKKAEIESLDVEIRKQFKETEGKIKDLPEVIKQRHRDFVKKYDENLNELKTNLDEIQKHSTESKELSEAITKTKTFLEKVRPPKRHQKLDPNKLPHRTAEPVWIEPRLNYSDELRVTSNELRTSDTSRITHYPSPILVASNGSLDGLLNSTPPPRPLATPPYQGGELWENSVSSPYQGEGRRGDVSELPSFQSSALAGNSNEMLLALADIPSPSDLAETIEVQFTSEIQAKAAELGHNPVKIYNWVRNNIEYVPTYGSIQGANMCLQTKQCNDMDTASLLIALLRTSGIHAKYVYGTIELPIEKVKNWAGGFTDSMEALRLFASAGVPTKGMTVGGDIKYVRLEHVYVEAFIDYIPSRGEIHKIGDTWISLDASFKQYAYTQGIDIKTAVPFDPQTFINQIQSTATINEQAGYVTGVNSSLIQQTMTDYQTQVQNYISQNYPNATVGDVLGKKEIIQQNYSYLLGTLPYKKIITGAKYSSLPDNYRHKLGFNVTKDMFDSELGTPINITKSLPELAGKKITISYLPASTADAQVISSYGYYDVPPYLISIKPVLFINGQNVAEGSSIGMGYDESLKINFSSPNRQNDVVEHTLTASSYVAIGLSPQNITNELIKTRYEKLNSAANDLDLRDVSVDELFGEILNIHALVYFRTVEIFDKMLASSYGLSMARHTAELTVAYRPAVKYIFGVPFDIGEINMEIDVKRYVSSQASLDGNLDDIKKFMIHSGTKASSMEHGIFEFLQPGVIGVSTVKILNEANNQGIPVFSINNANKSSILPLLQVMPETLNDISNAVAAGKVVTVPSKTIQFYNWYGDGYIVSDPETGSADYLISGKLLGGGIACNQATNAKIQNIEMLSYPAISGGTQSCPADDQGFGSIAQFKASLLSGGQTGTLGWIVAKNKFTLSAAFLESCEFLGGVLTSYLAAIEMYEKTNSHVAASLAFMANSMISFLFAKLIEDSFRATSGLMFTCILLMNVVGQILLTDLVLVGIRNQFDQK